MRERDQRVGGAMWEGLEGLFDEWEQIFNLFGGRNDGARAGEGGGQRCEDARLMSQVCC